MKCLTLVIVLVLALGTIGCGLFGGGNGDDPPPLTIEELLAMLPYGMVTDSTGGFVSPTCPHGFGEGHEDGDDMPEAHAPIMAAIVVAVNGGVLFTPAQSQQIRDFAASDQGATMLANVAQAACCPVAKGLLKVGGWQIHERPNPDEGEHPLYWFVHADGRVMGSPPAEPSP